MNVLCVSPSKYICSYVGYTSPSHHFMDLQQTIISWCQVYAFLGVKCNSDWMLCPPPRPTDRPTSTSQSKAHFVPLLSPLLSLPSHLIPHPVLFAPFLSSFLSPHFSALVWSLSIIVYLHSVHFLPSLMALRWGVFLVRHCNEDWNTISWTATVSFLHHPVLQQSDRCCCCCFGFPVCFYWCVSSSLSRYC